MRVATSVKILEILAAAARFASIAAALLFAVFPAHAQSYLLQTGTPTFVTPEPVELGFINAGNGNLHLQIPITSTVQRGHRPFQAALVYDSNIWQIVNSVWQPTNVIASQSGWRFATSVDPGTTSLQQATHRCVLGGRGFSYWIYTNFTWTSADGTQRFFPITTELDPNGCDGSYPPSATAYATDSSGFQMVISNATSAVVYAPDGTQVYPFTEDTNGNFYSSDYPNGNDVIDTLGRIPAKATTDCNGNSNQTCYDVPNSAGSTSRITVTTEAIQVHTAFAKSGVTEYSGTVTVIQSILLPDGTSYSFGYDSGSTAGHYGLLNSLTLPTGAPITYGYATFSDAFANVARWINSRTSGGATWTYTPAVVTACNGNQVGCTQSLTVTKPSADHSVYTFTLNNGAWAGQVQYYSGAVSPSNLVFGIINTWNFSNPCTLPGCTGNMNIQKVTTDKQFYGPSGSINSRVQMAYAGISTSMPTQISEWDFRAFFPTAPDRITYVTYLTGAGYTVKNINRPTSVAVCNPSGGSDTACNGTGTLLKQTKTVYDSYGSGGLSSVTHIANHDDTNFGTANTTRGNPTMEQEWVGGSSYLSTSYSYDTTGQVTSMLDLNGHTTQFSYVDSFYNDNGSNPPATFAPTTPTNAYLTHVVLPTTSSLNYGYYFGSGKKAFETDQNANSKYLHYQDSLDRPTLTSFSNGGWTLTNYTNSATTDIYSSISDAVVSTGCSHCSHNEIQLDSLGRTVQRLLINDPDGQTAVTSAYDPNGRVSTVTNPYRSTGDTTYGTSSFSYDVLDRVTNVLEPDGSASKTFYGSTVGGVSGSASAPLCSLAISPYPILSIDEAGKMKEVWIDGFGRTVEADEPSNTGGLTVATCYVHDLNGNLTHISQGAQNRDYQYDGFSRVTSAAVPETHNLATLFFYTNSTGGLCSGDPTAVCRRTDPRGITTTYSYNDPMNRLTQMAYSDGTPTVNYSYDQTLANGLSISNGNGERTSMTDGSGTTAWSYNAMGQATIEKRTISGPPSTNVTKTILYTYGRDGSLTSLTYPGGRSIQYSIGNAGRPILVQDSNGTKYVATETYAPHGALSTATYGPYGLKSTKFNDSRGYNNRLEYTSTQTSFTNTDHQTAVSVFGLALNYNTLGGNNGSVNTITDNLNSNLSVAFKYDSENRVLSGSTTSSVAQGCWGQSYGPTGNPPPGPPEDRWSNLSQINLIQCQGGQLGVTASSTTNQITTAGYGYDPAGDMTQEGSSLYSYDAEGRIKTAVGASGTTYCYVYDGRGFRVEKFHIASGTCALPQSAVVDLIYWRNMNGTTIEETTSTGGTTAQYVYAGRPLAMIDASGNVFTWFTDNLGSTELIADVNGSVCFETSYTPYGQEADQLTATCAPNYRFAGYELDSETGLYYAFARHYNPRLGRFMSLDPLSGSTASPQSLNRYAYVRNDPTNRVDPKGMDSMECRGGPHNCPTLPGVDGADPLGCELDGIQASCAGILSLITSDSAIVCPNNDCSQVFKATVLGVILKGVIPPGALVLNCVGADTDNDICFWASFSLRFVQGGTRPYLRGSYYALYLLNLAGNEASDELTADVKIMAAGVVGGASKAVVEDYLLGPTESALFGRYHPDAGGGFPGFLNDNDWLRLGYGWDGTQIVFRFSGDLLNGSHFDLWVPK